MDYGFVRVGAAFPKVRVADISYNCDNIIDLIIKAESKDVRMLVFPELCLSSYTCGDLFNQKLILQKSLQGLDEIVDVTRNTSTLCFIGMPIEYYGQVYNCCVVFQKGNILGIVPKTYIPNYNEFYEKRWFASGKNIKNATIKLFGEDIPFGVDILFEDDLGRGIMVGAEICEDMWVPVSPGSLLSRAGALILFNLSASNDLVGKAKSRERIIVSDSARLSCAYVYSSAGEGESTTDVVFGGYGMIAENGYALARRDAFEWDKDLLISDIDVEKLLSQRKKNDSFSFEFSSEYRKIAYGVKGNNADLCRDISPHPFVPSDVNEKNKNCSDVFSIQKAALRKRMEAIGCKNAVVGVSGGLDSTLALLVTVAVFKDLGIELQNILGVTMPGFGTSDKTYGNSAKLIRSLGVKFLEIDIKNSCEKHFEDIGHDPKVHDVTYENAQARERTKILMDLANKVGGIVVGTGDLSEIALGWCTYNGDHMSMYSVNAGVPKTLVGHMVSWIADNVVDEACATILKDIVKTPISPELLPPDEDGKISQETESILGSYELHDFFIYYTLRWGYSPTKILYLATKAFEGKYDKKQIKKVLETFIKRFFSQQFKRSCMPDGPKVGTVSLSPRGDLKMPSDASVQAWLRDLRG